VETGRESCEDSAADSFVVHCTTCFSELLPDEFDGLHMAPDVVLRVEFVCEKLLAK
jgi:hypothetical protein